MALKDLLVYVDPTEDSFERLRLAVDLAVRHESHLTALFAREWSRAQSDRHKSAELGLVSVQGMRDLERSIEASLQAAADRLRTALDNRARARGVSRRTALRRRRRIAIVPQYARYADLCILGRDQPEGPASVEYTFAEQLLFVTGRPVLFVPAVEPLTSLGRRISVAWNSSRPAARSLNDALPLIERAEHTTIVMINASGFIDPHGAPPGEHMVDHLRRHGAVADAVRIEDVPHGSHCRTGSRREAQALGADLMVAGAFGHPRLWEKMLGGVTYDLLARMNLPIFMSH